MTNRNQNSKNKRKKHPNKVKYFKAPLPICLAPPMYIQQENRNWMIRCSSSAAVAAGVITMANLAGMIGVIATGTTTSQYLCDQFRLRRVCVWGPVATAGTPVTVMLKYVDDPANNTQAGPPKTVSDSSVSYDRPAYACLEPPKDNSSIFSQWFDSSLTAQVLTVSWPAGSIIDFYFNFIVDDIGSTSAGPTLSGATTGNIYHKNFVLGSSTIGGVSPLNVL